jgi:hypothetical protein
MSDAATPIPAVDEGDALRRPIRSRFEKVNPGGSIMDGIDLEQTLVLIKPDALKYSLTGYVLSVLSEVHTGLRYAGAKIVHVNRMLAEEHYQEHRGKPFFPPLIDYIMGKLHYPGEAWKRRVIAIVHQARMRSARSANVPVRPTPSRRARKDPAASDLWAP